jgi:hypothetical protein
MKLEADTTTAPSLRRVLLFLTASAAVVAIAHALDPAVYRLVDNFHRSDSGVAKMFRNAGFLPLWLMAAVALILIDTARFKTHGLRATLQRGLPLMLSVILSVTVAEATRAMVQRQGPPPTGWNGHYQFRHGPFDVLHGDQAGMPSSPAAVVFGAVWALIRMHPRVTPLWIFISAGCAYQQLLAHAQFFSDICMAIVTSYAVAWLVWHAWRYGLGFIGLNDSVPYSVSSLARST